MGDKLNRQDCLRILSEKYDELKNSAAERYPKKSDFSEAQVVAIKSFLGPWPRALEAAGIKPTKNQERT